MFGFRDTFEPGGNRRCVWRRGTKDTEAVEAPARREGRGFKHLRPGAGLRVRILRGLRRQSNDFAQHLHEQSRNRQVGPCRVRRDMEQYDQSLALPRRGHERRSIRKPRPGLGREPGVRFGKHLARDGYLVGDGQAKKWALAVEGRKFFRGIPGHCAAQHAAAPAQPDRNEIAGGCGEMGSGKAHQDSAVLDKTHEAVMRLTRHHAGIGEDHNHHMVIEKGSHRIGGGGPSLADVREGGECLREIVAWREQRLRDVRRLAADEADPAAAPTFVEKKNRRRGMFASDFEAGDLVAQFDGHLETGLRLIRRAKIERCFAELKPLAIERADNPSLGGSLEPEGPLGAPARRGDRFGFARPRARERLLNP